MNKKFKNSKKVKKQEEITSKKELKRFLSEYTDDELNQIYDWLLSLPQKL